MKQFFTRKAVLFFCLLMPITYVISPSSALALTVNEVAKDLACPCECPLILEDCNMTCGLEWKNEIGELINKGMSKQQIEDYFIGKYGDDARITSLQKIQGKIYQYTRSFDKADWVLLWAGLLVWVFLMFFGLYLGIKKLFFIKSQDA
ncbi:MAG: cytochrome c-type biogenesis protein CcmH [Desulfuromonadaceae bacterium]|jgi:cytochrome c-type biogenesis protein CcmH/NrfF|nr:cytochrome c-type biogenesis protein CcmH [Desulfuromonadaceae bacterium]HUW25135.1 cytochrome c-type biogenesis protein CcmH [Gallionella sp.]